jgi:AGZA family xanthine/uracil permease-like MFS transporter
MADGIHFLHAFLRSLSVIPICPPNIAYGVIAGIVSYALLNSVPWVLRKVSNGKISPPTYDAAEPWAIPPGGITPPWM